MKFINNLIFALPILIVSVSSFSTPPIRKCTSLKTSVLTTIHGGAFNKRYMSVIRPRPIDEYGDIITIKRAAFESTPLPLMSDEKKLVNLEPVSGKHSLYAWEVYPGVNLSRRKRALHSMQPPWHCKETLEWVDLGKEYFPRYLRRVKCSCETCWYNSYSCQPRSFAINVLRKLSTECTQVSDKYQIFLQVKPDDYVEAWVWEEQFITVSCQCLWSPKK